jgi:putative ATP-dependent endonuclease of the OLD family
MLTEIRALTAAPNSSRSHLTLSPPVTERAKGALEQALFLGLSDAAVHKLLERAVEIHGEELIAAHIDGASNGATSLADCRGPVTTATRTLLAESAKTKKNSWFKTVSWMGEAARDIIGPDLHDAKAEFRDAVEAVFGWCRGA